MSSQGHMGLLQKANLLSQRKGLAFAEFIQKYNIKTCAIFTKINNEYFISQSVGFDGISICFSKSTSDFWNGLIPENNKIYNFSTAQKTLSSVLQFFSLKLKDEIDFADIYKTADNKILLLCNKELTDDITKSFKEIDVKQDYKRSFTEQMNAMAANLIVNKFSIDFEEAIEAFINENLKENQEIGKAALANELQNRLFQSFNAPHFYKKTNSTNARIILSSTANMPEELLISHIITILKPVLDNNAALINIHNEGKCQSYSQITDFLQD